MIQVSQEPLYAAPFRKKPSENGSWRRSVDGDEYNEIIARFGGVAEYNEARKKALAENPLLAVLEFKPCSRCGKAMSLYEEVRRDRGGKLRRRWGCIACQLERIAACNRKGKPISRKGEIELEQRGWTKAEKARAAWERAHAKRVETKGWSKLQFRKYGITQERYVELLEQQGYRCAMPGCDFVHRYVEWFALPPRKRGEKAAYHHHDYLLVVDHHHESGEVRSLLCPKCNLAVGTVEKLLGENISAFSLSRYIQDHNMRIAHR